MKAVYCSYFLPRSRAGTLYNNIMVATILYHLVVLMIKAVKLITTKAIRLGIELMAIPKPWL